MQEVRVQPSGGGGSGTAWAWALVVIVLVGIIAWLVVGRGHGSGVPDKVDVNVHMPAAGNSQQ